MRLFLLLLFLNAILMVHADARPLVWRTEKALSLEKDIPACAKSEDCLDYVSYVQMSKFGVKYYRNYYESVRVGIGFGSIRNEAGKVMADQLHPGAFDWGGEFRDGKFVPRYVVKRFYVYAESNESAGPANANRSLRKTELAIYRLMPNGGSCVLAGEKTTSSIAAAHRRAEQDLDRPSCFETTFSPYSK